MGAEDETSEVLRHSKPERSPNHAAEIAEPGHHDNHEGPDRIGQPAIGLDGIGGGCECPRSTANRCVQRISQAIDFARLNTENTRRFWLLRHGTNGLPHP